MPSVANQNYVYKPLPKFIHTLYNVIVYCELYAVACTFLYHHSEIALHDL